MSHITILVLAAGASARMGKIKQLLPWKNGTLLSNALDTARASKSNSVILITGANAAQIEEQIDQGDIAVLKNTKWKTGMGSSIVCGMQFLMANRPKCDAVLLMLADQPLIDTTYLNKLIDTYMRNQGGIVTTAYKSGPGVPAIFDKRYFDELLLLNKDYGARDIISAHTATVIVLDPGGKHIDIDTAQDYEQLFRQHQKINK